jgi:hypothetical protein
LRITRDCDIVAIHKDGTKGQVRELRFGMEVQVDLPPGKRVETCMDCGPILCSSPFWLLRDVRVVRVRRLRTFWKRLRRMMT